MPELQKSKSKMQNRFEIAVENLKKYNQGQVVLNTNFPKYATGQKYVKPLDKLRIQNSDFQKCYFLAPITKTNISGSRLRECIFDTIDLKISNIQFSSFHGCRFDSCNLNGSNFSNCFINKVEFNNNTFMGSNFSRSQFKNCKICGGEMLSSSFEFAGFQNTYFENLRLANLSMEYSEFNHIEMNRVVLPFAQLPFIFGGLDYVISTQDDVSISANMGEIDRISIEEYIETFEDWKIFFYNRELYFPLANILLAQEKKDEALEAILSGILMMINHCDYRMLKYLCKLAASHQSVSKAECKMLYSRIQELILMTIQNSEQEYSYEIHMNDIKNILVENPKAESRLYLSIQTNILTDNQEILYRLINFIEIFLDSSIFTLTTKTISIRHDSPYEIIVVAFGTIYILSKIFEVLTKAFGNIRVVADDIMALRDIGKNRAENDDLDNRLKVASLRKEELEIEKLILEIQKLQNEMTINNIQTKITHNIKENDKIYIS